ncbi:unnamed protein product, partial [Polarella glacialis]
GQAAAGGKGKSVRINTYAVLKRSCKPLLDIICTESSGAFKAVEEAAAFNCQVFFVWSGQALLQRLAHPSATYAPGEACVPQLPAAAWVNRFPGMGCICDKVNMALALRLLQQLWPSKFRFWPKSWLLPAESELLSNWMEKHKGETVIVKPEGGSQGDGIFLVQSAADLRLKLSAKPHFGAGFGALAQRYLPAPLLLDGLKFDLRLYVVITPINPLCAYLCNEGLARFCTAKYEEPTPANANEVYMHLTNYSVNKKSAKFSDEDPFEVHTKASKRPLATLLLQIAAHEESQGRSFYEASLYSAFEEVCAVLLQSMAPVLSVTYDRVAAESKRKPKPKPKAKAKAKQRGEDSSDEGGEEEDEEDPDEFAPNCFQVLGVDVLMDEKLQPWLLEVSARPSMSVSDVHVKRLVVEGACRIAAAGGDGPAPAGFFKMDFDRYSPSEAQETLQAVTRIYQVFVAMPSLLPSSGGPKCLCGSALTELCSQKLQESWADFEGAKWSRIGGAAFWKRCLKCHLLEWQDGRARNRNRHCVPRAGLLGRQLVEPFYLTVRFTWPPPSASSPSSAFLYSTRGPAQQEAEARTGSVVAAVQSAGGGAKKAFATSGLRRGLAGAVSAGLAAHELDSAVTRWKHQGYRQDGQTEDYHGDVGVLDFAALLQEVAVMRAKGSDEDPLEALTSLVELCDPAEWAPMVSNVVVVFSSDLIFYCCCCGCFVVVVVVVVLIVAVGCSLIVVVVVVVVVVIVVAVVVVLIVICLRSVLNSIIFVIYCIFIVFFSQLPSVSLLGDSTQLVQAQANVGFIFQILNCSGRMCFVYVGPGELRGILIVGRRASPGHSCDLSQPFAL